MTQTAAPDETLRYPIGRFKPVTGADAATRTAWIEDIARAPEQIAGLVRGLNRDQLLTPYRDGGWTVAQVVHHVADSHLNAYIRTRFAIAEDNFTVKPYDERRWAQFPDAVDPDVEPSLHILLGIHSRWVTLLKSLPHEAFDRALVHPERGPITIGWLTNLYAWHGRHHAGHIAGLRERQGW